MKKLLLACAALATLASASVASAQPYVPGYGFNSIDRREAADARRISWCVHVHGMSPRTAFYLRMELRQIEILEARLRWGGLNYWEYRLLSARLSRLEAEIARACHPFVHFPLVLEREPHFPVGPGPVELEERF
jgi:hypothetical protein